MEPLLPVQNSTFYKALKNSTELDLWDKRGGNALCGYWYWY